MIQTLRDRVTLYEDISSTKMLPKLPIILTINGRNFRNLTKDIPKPFSEKFADIMQYTALKSLNSIEGIVFCYVFNDEIVFLLRNDQSLNTKPWYENKIQKIVSAASSIVTIEFIRTAGSHELKFNSDPVFVSSVFTVPNINEALNVLTSKQQLAFQLSVNQACYYEFSKKYDDKVIEDILNGRTTEEKIEILLEECNINFYSYEPRYHRGVAIYKNSTLIDQKNKIYKDRWYINTEIPIFTKDHSFLNDIINK